MSQMAPPPGWYPDPQMTGTLRYWNGAAFTSHVAPMRGAAGPQAAPDGLITIAYVLAVLMPFIGVIVGIVVAAKGSAGHGAAAILIGGFLTTAMLIGAGYL